MEEPTVEEPKVDEPVVAGEVTVAEVQPDGEAPAEVPAAEAMVEVVAADPNEVPALVPAAIQAKKKRRSSGTVPRWTTAEEEVRRGPPTAATRAGAHRLLSKSCALPLYHASRRPPPKSICLP